MLILSLFGEGEEEEKVEEEGRIVRLRRVCAQNGVNESGLPGEPTNFGSEVSENPNYWNI